MREIKRFSGFIQGSANQKKTIEKERLLPLARKLLGNEVLAGAELRKRKRNSGGSLARVKAWIFWTVDQLKLM